MAAQEQKGHLATRQVSPMPSISEAVERAAVANGGKNLIDRGPRCYERSPGELLPQTFPSEPSTAVEQQQANPLPDRATSSDK